MSFKRSSELFQAAQRVIPGGVNSPVRAFKAVGGQPIFIQRGQGAHLYDVDGNAFVDYVMSWGPLILGHAEPGVVAAIEEAARQGTSFGAPTERELVLAELICGALPSVEQVRLVNSGTEATMSALRLARAFTGREKIVKFEGGYHGHADMLLAAAGSGLATLGVPECPGVPAGAAAPTLIAPYNDVDAVRALFRASPGQIAAVIVEPVAGNMGVVPPASGFLSGLRDLTAADGALLIFDEVITGFRVGYGGAQSLYGIRPDLTCLGKVIGGGLPVGAFGGRREIMQMLAPVGPVYQAGTLSGNPLATAAGIATLRALGVPGVYERLEAMSARLVEGLTKAAEQAGVPVRINRVGSLFSAFFTDRPVTDYRSAKTSDTQRFAAFFRGLLDRGIYVAPSQFEAWFVSLAHGEAEIDRTVAAAAEALAGR